MAHDHPQRAGDPGKRYNYGGLSEINPNKTSNPVQRHIKTLPDRQDFSTIDRKTEFSDFMGL
jgi:hypothetical protein